MNINETEKYMKNLSPEFQEKVSACRNVNEMVDLFASEGIELPDEALDIVTGGTGNETPSSDSQAKMYMCCPKCNHSNGSFYSVNSGIGSLLRSIAEFNCKKYGYHPSNYIIVCADCNLTLCAKSKDNVC